MSLTAAVAVKVNERRATTLDELMPDFPKHERYQIQKALENAKARGLIHLAHRRNSKSANQAPSLWTCMPEGSIPVDPMARRKRGRPAASVWELGTDLREHLWPPKGDGRQFLHLTDGDLEDAGQAA